MTTETIAIDRAHLDTILEQLRVEIGDAPCLAELHLRHGRASGALVVLAGLRIIPQAFAVAHMNAHALAANARGLDLYKLLEAQTGLTFH